MKRLVWVIMMVACLAAPLTVAASEDDGRTIVYGTWDPRLPEEGTAVYDRLVEAEERLNVKMTELIYPSPEIVERITAGVLAGETDMDVQQMQYLPNFIPLVAAGMLLPLDDVIPEEYWDTLPPVLTGLRDAVVVDGHTYGFHSGDMPVQLGTVVVWNRALFEELGLPDVGELLVNGEWTWDAMTEAAIRATRDTDGDGAIDQWGISGYLAWPTFQLALLYTNGAYPTRTVDGKEVFNLLTEEAYEGLTQLYEWFTVHQVMGPFAPTDQTPFVQGKVAMMVCEVWRAFSLLSTDENVGLTFLPKGPRSDRYVVPVANFPLTGIPVTVDDPDTVFELFNAVWSPEAIQEAAERNAESAMDLHNYETYLQVTEQWEIISLWTQHLMDAGLWSAMSQVVAGNKTPAAGMEEVRPMVQAVLDDVTGYAD